jgi:SpoVK/Ycf46/Vps4 family AAA+-type ATPase
MDVSRRNIFLYYAKRLFSNRGFVIKHSVKLGRWIKEYGKEIFSPQRLKIFACEFENRAKHLEDQKKRKISPFLSTNDLRNEIMGEIFSEWISKAAIPSSLEGQGNIIKQADIISDAFNLSDPEREAIRLTCSEMRIDCLRYLIHQISGINGIREHSLSNNDENKYIGTLLNLSSQEVRAALGYDSLLFKTGLIIISRNSTVYISAALDKLISTPTLGKNSVKSLLLTKAPKALLGRDDFKHIAEDYEFLANLLRNALQNGEPGVNILLYGPPGTGKTELAKTLCAEIKTNLYSILDAGNDDESDRAAIMAAAKTLLKGDSNAVILFDEAEDVFNYYGTNYFGSKRRSKLHLNAMLENNEIPIIWITNNADSMDPAQLRRFTYMLCFKIPPRETREIIWGKILKKSRINLEKEKIEKLSEKYEIPPSFAANAIKVAKLVNDNGVIDRVLDGFLKVTDQIPKPETQANDKAVFLPELLNTDVNLVKLADMLAAKGQMNFSLCLYGPPGTGKTEFVRYLSEKLNLTVLKKRMSDLLSKFVGNTEKNIAEAFREALDKKMFLLFDEADSCLFDRRLAVRSFEFSATNEMLTWMESHPFPFACTTNLIDRMDKASLRRFTFKVKFEYLTPSQTSLAFKHFFGVSRPTELDNVTPADFALAAKKASILGVVKTEELFDLLKQEVLAKGVNAQKIGF